MTPPSWERWPARGGQPARQSVDAGETWDFEFLPEPGEYRLVLGNPAKPILVQQLVVR
jgi:hypothetical protein